MKDLRRAIAMYFRCSLVPMTPLIVIAEFIGIIMLAILAGSIIDDFPSPVMTNLSVKNASHLIVASFFLMGALRASEFKFFSSPMFAKHFTVTAPVISALMLCIPLDVILFLIMPGCPAEALIVNALNTVVICFIAASLNKSGLQAAGILLFIPFLLQIGFWNSERFAGGFGLSVPAAAAFALVIYIAGTALNLFIMNIWWKWPGRRMTGKDGATGDITAINRLLRFLDN